MRHVWNPQQLHNPIVLWCAKTCLGKKNGLKSYQILLWFIGNAREKFCKMNLLPLKGIWVMFKGLGDNKIYVIYIAYGLESMTKN
jgi:hypothetical protein